MDKQEKRKLKNEIRLLSQHTPLLQTYGNLSNLRHLSGADDTYRIVYESGKGWHIRLDEVISRDSGRHILELSSVTILMDDYFERIIDKKEAALHYHPQKGHTEHHLQFTIMLNKTRKIRINLDKLDQQDYLRCLRGFLCIAGEIIASECCHGGVLDLTSYFFNTHVQELEYDREFLKSKIAQNTVLGENDKPLLESEIRACKQNIHVSLFFR